MFILIEISFFVHPKIVGSYPKKLDVPNYDLIDTNIICATQL